mmetsp:Transcript_1676/g.3863  ORF Transcript_1676/g.3863 Transcript_1676/m.3863 type:complete len:310 (-) Transcript_1676:141-1070(-)
MHVPQLRFLFCLFALCPNTSFAYLVRFYIYSRIKGFAYFVAFVVRLAKTHISSLISSFSSAPTPLVCTASQIFPQNQPQNIRMTFKILGPRSHPHRSRNHRRRTPRNPLRLPIGRLIIILPIFPTVKVVYSRQYPQQSRCRRRYQFSRHPLGTRTRRHSDHETHGRRCWYRKQSVIRPYRSLSHGKGRAGNSNITIPILPAQINVQIIQCQQSTDSIHNGIHSAHFMEMNLTNGLGSMSVHFGMCQGGECVNCENSNVGRNVLGRCRLEHLFDLGQVSQFASRLMIMAMIVRVRILMVMAMIMAMIMRV